MPRCFLKIVVELIEISVFHLPVGNYLRSKPSVYHTVITKSRIERSNFYKRLGSICEQNIKKRL